MPEPQDTAPLRARLTWRELVDLLDAGLSPQQIDRILFLRWRRAQAGPPSAGEDSGCAA